MTGRRVTRMGEKSPIWTIHDLAAFCGVSAASICRYYQSGYKVRSSGLDFRKLPRYKLGGMWRWMADDVKSWIRGRVCQVEA